MITTMQHTCNRFGALGDGMLGEFTRKDEANGGLDFARRNGRLLRVSSKFYK